jgi:hypothetical protein
LKTQVYITVDVESSMGGAWSDPALRPVPSSRRIFCDIQGESHGIGFLTRELGSRGMRGTFFSEVFAAKVFGDQDTSRWFDHLLHSGQDVQLHTHLNFHHYARYLATGEKPLKRPDSLARVDSPQLMRELCEEAIDLFQRFAGSRPLVYRGGSWICSRELTTEFSRLGIQLDSSFNPSMEGAGSFTGESLQPNLLQRLGDIWELPVSVARQRLPEASLQGDLRPLDPTSMSVAELKTALDFAHAGRSAHVCVVLHSFSAVKAADYQYTRLRPDHVVQRRFCGLLDYLHQNSDRFEVSTLGELAASLEQHNRSPAPSEAVIPDLGLIKPLMRKIVQGVNRLI